MKFALLTACLLTVPSTPALSQSDSDQTWGALSRYLHLLLPEYAELLGRLAPPDHYAAPEILPNGDILIRRKPKALPPPRDGEIDL